MGNGSSTSNGRLVNGDGVSHGARGGGGGGGGGFDGGRLLRLTYFDANFRAELIRLTLSAGGVSFVDRRVSYQDWQEMKSKTPLGGLPTLEYGDETLGQSTAIARFAAKAAGLDGGTLVGQARADMVVDLYWELLTRRIALLYSLKDEEEKIVTIEDIFDKHFPEFFRICEKLVKESDGVFVNGEEMTYADIAIMDIIFRMRNPEDKTFKLLGKDEERRKLPESYPLLGQLTKKVLENEGIQEYFRVLRQG